jgi:MFS transporter, PPP family, 3-phenylpropionic acid transporter
MLWRLRLYYFAYLAALGGFSPFFGLFVKERGFSEWHVSILMGLWYATRVFAPSSWNLLLERSRQPIQWLRWGAVGCLLTTALFLVPWNFAGMLITMTLFASLFNALMPQFEAITLQHLRAQPGRYSGVRLWGSVGFLIVVIGFGALFKNYSAALLIWAMLPLMGLLIYASWINHYAENDCLGFQKESTSVKASSSNRALLASKPFLLLLAVMMFNQIAHGPLYVYFGIYLKSYGFDELLIGKLWALGVLCEIIAFASMRSLLARVSPVRLLTISLAVGTLRWYVTAAFPQSLLSLALMQCFHAFTFAAMHAAGMQLLSDWLAPEQQGKAQSLLYGIASGMGGVLGALIAGFVWLKISPNAAFYVAASFSATAIFFCMGLARAKAAIATKSAR